MSDTTINQPTRWTEQASYAELVARDFSDNRSIMERLKGVGKSPERPLVICDDIYESFKTAVGLAAREGNSIYLVKNTTEVVPDAPESYLRIEVYLNPE